MLEYFLGCAPFVALCLLPFIVIPPFFSRLICKLRVIYIIDKILNSTTEKKKERKKGMLLLLLLIAFI